MDRRVLKMVAMVVCLAVPSSADLATAREADSHSPRRLAVGAARLSAPDGDRIPYAEAGWGLFGQFWYAPVPAVALGIQIGWTRADFDKAAFYEQLDNPDDEKFSYSPYTMAEGAALVRLAPIAWRGWRPFLVAGFTTMNWREKYRHDDLTPGPWWPTGVFKSADRTISAVCLSAGAGLRYEDKAGIGVFVTAEELFASGDLDGRWSRLRFGLSWRL